MAKNRHMRVAVQAGNYRTYLQFLQDIGTYPKDERFVYAKDLESIMGQQFDVHIQLYGWYFNSAGNTIADHVFAMRTTNYLTFDLSTDDTHYNVFTKAIKFFKRLQDTQEEK